MDYLTLDNCNRALLALARNLDDPDHDPPSLPDQLDLDPATVDQLVFALEAGGFVRRCAPSAGSINLGLTYTGIIKVETLERDA